MHARLRAVPAVLTEGAMGARVAAVVVVVCSLACSSEAPAPPKPLPQVPASPAAPPPPEDPAPSSEEPPAAKPPLPLPAPVPAEAWSRELGNAVTFNGATTPDGAVLVADPAAGLRAFRGEDGQPGFTSALAPRAATPAWWGLTLPATVGPVVDGDLILLRTDVDRLVALDAATGVQRWSKEFTTEMTGPLQPGSTLIATIAAGDPESILVVVSALGYPPDWNPYLGDERTKVMNVRKSDGSVAWVWSDNVQSSSRIGVVSVGDADHAYATVLVLGWHVVKRIDVHDGATSPLPALDPIDAVAGGLAVGQGGDVASMGGDCPPGAPSEVPFTLRGLGAAVIRGRALWGLMINPDARDALWLGRAAPGGCTGGPISATWTTQLSWTGTSEHTELLLTEEGTLLVASGSLLFEVDAATGAVPFIASLDPALRFSGPVSLVGERWIALAEARDGSGKRLVGVHLPGRHAAAEGWITPGGNLGRSRRALLGASQAGAAPP